MTLTKREKVLISTLLIVLILSAFLYFLIFPMIDKIKSNSVERTQQRIILNNLQQANETGELTELEKQVQDEITRIEAILPTQVRFPEVYLEVLGVAKDTGIKQESFIMQDFIVENIPATNETSENQNTQEKLMTIPINHRFIGSYKQIKEYIDRIQRCGRKIDIMEYELTDNNGEDKISADFILHSYALVKDGQNLSGFVDYDFIQGSYGRRDPFVSEAEVN